MTYTLPNLNGWPAVNPFRFRNVLIILSRIVLGNLSMLGLKLIQIHGPHIEGDAVKWNNVTIDYGLNQLNQLAVKTRNFIQNHR